MYVIQIQPADIKFLLFQPLYFSIPKSEILGLFNSELFNPKNSKA